MMDAQQKYEHWLDIAQYDLETAKSMLKINSFHRNFAGVIDISLKQTTAQPPMAKNLSHFVQKANWTRRSELRFSFFDFELRETARQENIHNYH